MNTFNKSIMYKPPKLCKYLLKAFKKIFGSRKFNYKDYMAIQLRDNRLNLSDSSGYRKKWTEREIYNME